MKCSDTHCNKEATHSYKLKKKAKNFSNGHGTNVFSVVNTEQVYLFIITVSILVISANHAIMKYYKGEKMNHISFRRWCIKRFFKKVKDVCMIPFAVIVLLIAIFIISGLFLPDIFYAQSFVKKGFIGAGLVSGIILLISGIYIYVIQSIIEYRNRLYLKYKEESSMNKEVKQ